MKDVTVGKGQNNNIKYSYIAGFLDGDGAISAIIERHPEKKFKYRVRITLDFYQHKNNVAVLEYIRRIIGEGCLGKSIRNTHKLSIKNQTTLKKILPVLYRYSVIKKKQIKLALKILHSEVKSKQGLIRNAKIADMLCGLNVRSGNIRKNDSSIII